MSVTIVNHFFSLGGICAGCRRRDRQPLHDVRGLGRKSWAAAGTRRK